MPLPPRPRSTPSSPRARKAVQDRRAIATSTRLAAAKGNDIWMRVVMLAPSASNAMSTTVLGDTDMTLMRSYFVKPQAAIAMTFSDDPMMGMTMRPLHRIGDRASWRRSRSCCAPPSLR